MEEVAGLPVPAGLQDRVRLWVKVYAEYDRERVILYHGEHPGIIYKVVRPADLKEEVAALQDRLMALQEIVDSDRPPFEAMLERDDAEELMALYKKLCDLPGKDRFKRAADMKAIGWLSGRKNQLLDSYARAAPYLPVMELIFEQRGLPPALTRLVFVESMFKRDAVSGKGAAGVWQLMPDAAAPYLTMSRALDERRDPVAATRAAASVLHKNYRALGSWPLAVTAYNAGVYRMKEAMESTGEHDLAAILEKHEDEGIGFAVKNFYPQLIAVLMAERIRGPESMKTAAGPDPLAYELAPMPESLTLSELVRKTGIDREVLVSLNPAWTAGVENDRTMIPEGYLLRVPEAAVMEAEAALGSKPFGKPAISD